LTRLTLQDGQDGRRRLDEFLVLVHGSQRQEGINTYVNVVLLLMQVQGGAGFGIGVVVRGWLDLKELHIGTANGRRRWVMRLERVVGMMLRRLRRVVVAVKEGRRAWRRRRWNRVVVHDKV
jgi:hypothetical protein